MKKNYYIYIGGVLILIVGMILGASIINFKVKKNNGKAPETKINLIPQQINSQTVLAPGRVFMGSVTSIEGNQLNLSVKVATSSIDVKVPVDSQDSVSKLQRSTESKFAVVSASFSDIKVGDSVSVRVGENNKKMIFILAK